jgi:hypothetical protein
MFNFFEVLIGSIINAYGLIYIGSHVNNQNINYHSKRYYYFLLILAFYMCISYLLTSSLLRVIISNLLLIYIYHSLFEINYKKAIVTTLITLVIEILSELFFDYIVINIINISLDVYKQKIFANLFSNLIITLFAIFLINIINIKKRAKFLNGINDITSFSIIVSLICSLYLVYYDATFSESVLIAIIYVITIALIGNNFLKKEYDYKLVLDNLNEYQNMYYDERALSHEYQNNLLLLKSMNYIDYKEYINKIIYQTNHSKLIIPDNYLNDIIQSKLEIAKKHNLNLEVSIEPSFVIKDYLLIDSNKRIAIAHLLAIYLDNAINASIQAENKDILIVFAFIDNEYTIKIINKYKNCNQVKDKRHGNGLRIADSLIKNSHKINVTTLIKGNTYIKTIKIKM